ncbi:MAG TPA: helix-turn-helix domain-containing protein [Caulobacteraceae bacterium]|jgi:AcrR family transcriptional regulator|nr:helix-turn-helix domain-containing protein [Caulobacteraceae bacterium]
MGPASAKSARRERSDAIHNRERIVEAATRVFSAGGRQAKLDAVAREAGVGIGTLYRHFPTREALFEAVYRHEVDHLAELAQRLAQEADPVEALREWVHANVRLAATKKGMVEALQLVAHGSSELKAYSFERLTAALALLLERGVAAGELRADITAEDLLRTVVGILYAESGADWPTSTLRIVDVFVDGLRKR